MTASFLTPKIVTSERTPAIIDVDNPEVRALVTAIKRALDDLKPHPAPG